VDAGPIGQLDPEPRAAGADLLSCTTSGISESAGPLTAEAAGDGDAALAFSIQRLAVSLRTPSSAAISAAPAPPRIRSPAYATARPCSALG